jgi:Iap family predicted aminopeptidase
VTKFQTLSLIVVLFSLPSFLMPVSSSAQLKISTDEEIKAEFDSVPCKNENRLNAVRALFEKMGVPSSDVSIDKHKNVENLVIRKQGIGDEKIVVGAHYDKVEEGCGSIDNWTGIVTLAHLYKTIKEVSFKKTVLFVAFGKEEKGLIGSRAMVDSISKEQINQYCAMINIDSLGLGAPQVAHNMSSQKLEEMASTWAKEMKMPFGNASIEYADSDSSSFLAKKIPAITIHGLTKDWASILHSRNDQSAKINSLSVYLGYRLALAVLVSVNNGDCGAYK